ncbi:MAG: hypothetical protein KAJ86_07125 [Alphaproteobacteria bacterium]|nr:hypothetical protein [Alphaproteobacteria bacterium]
MKLTDTFVSGLSENYRTVAFTIFAELIGNVSGHSESQILGFAALQKYGGKKKHIQTVVSDSGLGIAKTLRPSLEQHYPYLHELYECENIESDIGLVIEVLTKGEISRFGAGRGLGFKSSREQAMKFDATLSIRQKSFSLEFVYKDGALVEVNKDLDLVRIYGSHVCFDFNC